MTSERWQRIESIFSQAMNLPPAKRNQMLKDLCGEDLELIQEVTALIEQNSEIPPNIFESSDSFPDGPDFTGKRIGPYRIESLIERGGMAEVYRAIRDDDQYNKLVAVKLVRQTPAALFFINRLRYERQILANLEHPCIARFLEAGTTEDGIHYLVMEHIDGDPITDYSTKNHLPIGKRLELFKSVCDAVQYAHKNLVIHRDIKPKNILVTSDGTPKLLDFGIAKLLNPDQVSNSSSTITALRLMTPGYASPEQVRGEQSTTATDIYSLGAVLYELLSGEGPHQFKTKFPSEIERVVCEQDPVVPSVVVMKGARTAERKRLSKEIAHDLDNIVMMAMQKDPAKRYATVSQFSEDISRYLDGLPVKARPQTTRYRAVKFVKRHKFAAATAALFLVLLTAFAIAMTLQASRIAKERDRANQVTEFLVDLFEVSNPDESKGNNVTARELLNASTDKIERDLKQHPEIQAALMDTMGRVYINLGLYGTAVPLLQKSLDVRRQTLGDENLDVASSMNHLAEALQNEGKFDESNALAEKALAMRRRILGNEHPEIASSLSIVGGNLYSLSKLDEAESVFREALAIREKAFGPENVDIATSLTQLALILQTKGNVVESLPLQRRALAIRRRLLGNSHPSVSTSLNNLGRALLDLADYDGAIAMLREAVELDRKSLGENHPDLTTTMSSLAWALKETKQYDESELIFRKALEVRRKALGNQHPSTAITIGSLAVLLIEVEKLEEAELLVREAESIWKKTLPPTHANHAHIHSAYGKIQMARGEYEQAEQSFRKTLAIRSQTFAADHPMIASTKLLLGECLIASAQYDEAETLLLEAYQVVEKKKGKDHPHTLEASAMLSSLYQKSGKHQ